MCLESLIVELGTLGAAVLASRPLMPVVFTVLGPVGHLVKQHWRDMKFPILVGRGLITGRLL